MFTLRSKHACSVFVLLCVAAGANACSSEPDDAGAGAGAPGTLAGSGPGGMAQVAGSGGSSAPAGGSSGSGVAGSFSPGGAPGGGSMSTGGVSGGAGMVTAGAAGTTPMGGASGAGGQAGALAGGSSNMAGSGNAGKGGTGGTAGAPSAGSGGGATDPALAKFSFFVTSYPALKSLSGKAEGFGGDLRFGKADGLSGADEICRRVAEMGMPGAGQKQWRAFLSVTNGPDGMPVNARDRIGTGPWHDRMGRLVANNLEGLFAGARPAGDAALVEDLTTERGEPNHYVGPNGLQAEVVDNHDTLTGSDASGRLKASSAADTCNDWTSTT
ncbi:MAG TPA: hypothetical protein VIM73_09430, partial [Polyangiaceae bacterium]